MFLETPVIKRLLDHIFNRGRGSEIADEVSEMIL